MTEIRPATVGDLLDGSLRGSVEVAMQGGVDGELWLATSIDCVRRFPESVRWQRVEAAERVGAEVSVLVDGHTFAQAPSYAIAVRDLPRS